jgi:hypothetical protein
VTLARWHLDEVVVKVNGWLKQNEPRCGGFSEGEITTVRSLNGRSAPPSI